MLYTEGKVDHGRFTINLLSKFVSGIAKQRESRRQTANRGEHWKKDCPPSGARRAGQ